MAGAAAPAAAEEEVPAGPVPARVPLQFPEVPHHGGGSDIVTMPAHDDSDGTADSQSECAAHLHANHASPCCLLGSIDVLQDICAFPGQVRSSRGGSACSRRSGSSVALRLFWQALPLACIGPPCQPCHSGAPQQAPRWRVRQRSWRGCMSCSRRQRRRWDRAAMRSRDLEEQPCRRLRMTRCASCSVQDGIML